MSNVTEFPCFEPDDDQVQHLTYIGMPLVSVPLVDLVPEDAVYTDNDEGLAKRFLDIFRIKVRYCVEEKQWYIFDNVCWKPDLSDQVFLLARKALNASYTKEIAGSFQLFVTFLYFLIM